MDYKDDLEEEAVRQTLADVKLNEHVLPPDESIITTVIKFADSPWLSRFIIDGETVYVTASSGNYQVYENPHLPNMVCHTGTKNVDDYYQRANNQSKFITYVGGSLIYGRSSLHVGLRRLFPGSNGGSLIWSNTIDGRDQNWPRCTIIWSLREVVATTTNSGTFVYDLFTGKLKRQFSIYGEQMTSSGQNLLCVQGRVLSVYSVVTGELLRTFSFKHILQHKIVGIAVLPDGKILILQAELGRMLIIE